MIKISKKIFFISSPLWVKKQIARVCFSSGSKLNQNIYEELLH